MGLSNLSIEAILIVLFFGIQAPRCANKKLESEEFWFFCFGCSVCNKFLLLFSSTLILTYLEPILHYVGVSSILLFSYAHLQKLLLRHAVLSDKPLNG